MGNKYYYLIASLPSLFFDEESPISIEDFRTDCRRWLSKGDFRNLLHSDPLPAGRKWKDFNRALRKELAGIRSLKKSHPEEKVHSELKDIFDEPDPLQMEKRFERIRWDFLEQNEFHYFFDINRLVIYLYKLHILERLASFNKEKGMQTFEALCGVRLSQ